MQLWTAPDRVEFRQLHTNYRETWQRFSSEVSNWRSLIDGGEDETVIRRAENEVARTQACYRESRDRLASHMLARRRTDSQSYAALAEEISSNCLTGTYY